MAGVLRQGRLLCRAARTLQACTLAPSRCLSQATHVHGEAQVDTSQHSRPYLNSLQTPGKRGNNPRKRFLLRRVEETLLEPTIVLMYHANNLTAGQWEDTRFKATQAGGTAKQLRNGIARAFLRDTKFSDLGVLFSSSTICIYTNEYEAIARLTKLKHSNLELLGGKVEERVLTAGEIMDIAKLPSLDVLRAQLVGLLSTPSSRLVTALESHPSELAAALSRYSSSTSEDGVGSGDAA